MKAYNLNSIVRMKKEHPCHTNEWQIIRIGVDVKLKCLKCKRIVMMSRLDFNKKLKKVLKE